MLDGKVERGKQALSRIHSAHDNCLEHANQIFHEHTLAIPLIQNI